MGKRIGMEVAVAVAEAVGLCNIDMAAVYPITPQSHIAEHLSDLVADGHIDCEFVTVESEHSAMSAVIGALLKVIGVMELDAMKDAIDRRFGRIAQKNLNAMKRAYDEIKILN